MKLRHLNILVGVMSLSTLLNFACSKNDVGHPIPIDEGYGKHPADSPLSPQSVNNIKVLIFPHWGKYATPQNRETVPTEITLQSEQNCNVSPDSDHSQIIQSEKTIKFIMSDLTQAVWVNCPAPTTLVRESGLKNFTYRGSFWISPGKAPDGTAILWVVNVLPFEDYLKGVVPSEVPSDWPTETLKAQAVAARTYAEFEVRASKAEDPNKPFDLDDTVQYQAYLGLYKAVKATDDAVDNTSGKIMTHAGKVIKAYFHADSGGHTEDALNAFGDQEANYCKGKAEVYDPALVKSDWSKTLTQAELITKLSKAKIISEKSIPTELSIISRFDSGRTESLLLTLKGEKPITLKGSELRFALGLRSNFLSEIEILPDGSFRALGKGFGHGAGMSQEGARALAQGNHWNFEQILKFYYTDIDL